MSTAASKGTRADSGSKGRCAEAEGNISGWSLGLRTARPSQAIEHVERGFEVKALARFQEHLDLSTEELADLMHISTRTLTRRRKEGRLKPTESDRLYRLAHLFERAVEVMSDETSARRWLTSEQWGLGGAVPLHYARTEPGAREVETLLDRIDYGVLP